MSREELIAKAAADAGVNKTVAAEVLKSFLDSITNALASGEKVSLVGFGTFSVGERKARTGKIPGTNKEIQIPAAKVPKFKAGKNLKDAVAG
jgi:DNA-binding protein HU-beta